MSEENQPEVESEEDSAEYNLTTTGGYKIRCRASRGNGDIVMLSVRINDILHTYGDTVSDGASLYSEARQEAQIVARLLDNGMIRRKGDDWEVARNATFPVPDGWVAKWRE